MFAQVRIYTINKGMMDDWIKLFNEQMAPLHEKHGIKIIGAWANRPQNEFVWIRAAESEEDLKEKMKAFMESPERKALGTFPGTHHAKTEVRDTESVYEPVGARV